MEGKFEYSEIPAYHNIHLLHYGSSFSTDMEWLNSAMQVSKSTLAIKALASARSNTHHKAALRHSTHFVLSLDVSQQMHQIKIRENFYP